jgi:hypothetical protein
MWLTVIYLFQKEKVETKFICIFNIQKSCRISSKVGFLIWHCAGWYLVITFWHNSSLLTELWENLVPTEPFELKLFRNKKATFEIEQCWIFVVLWRPFWKWKPGINSEHHNLPTYEISLKSDNVEFVRWFQWNFICR